MARYLLSSHDGFGLGHVRRNFHIAGAIRALDTSSRVTVVTGAAALPSWNLPSDVHVVQVPPLVKDECGVYAHAVMGFDEALHLRSERFREVVDRFRPDVVLVDRHPFGIGGELRPGLELARRRGARAALGLRDILDEPERVRTEVLGPGWDGVEEAFDEVLVYGDRSLCDHGAEYGMPISPRYCGWVTGRAHPPATGGGSSLLVAAGGGGDGRRVFDLGLAILRRRSQWQARIVVGPYAQDWMADGSLSGRVTLISGTDGATELTGAGAVLQMAGYNSTVEALAAGHRPILLPRRAPRREQAIRAARLAALGMADVVDDAACPDEVAWLLDRTRRLAPGALARTGLRIDGAQRAAEHLLVLARSGHQRAPVPVAA